MAVAARITGVITLLLALATPAHAQTPDAVVRSTVDDVLALIQKTKDQRTLIEIAEKTVLPRFDFRRMTQLAVGRGWGEATPDQRDALERAFRTLLVRTYTAALTHASGETKVEVKPSPAKAGATEATVRTVVHEPGRKPIPIDYRMTQTSENWKVYDVVVENLSLVTNYRGSFQSEIARTGIEGLIKVIEQRNQQLKG